LEPSELSKALGEALLNASREATGRAVPVEIFGDVTEETLGRAVIQVHLAEPVEADTD
jgi:hypothetical protein